MVVCSAALQFRLAGPEGGRILSSAFKRGVREHPLRLFFPLAFLLSWYPTLLSFVGVHASGINPLGVLAAALNVPAFLLSVFAGGVVAAWLFNSAKESVLLCMLFHASVNAVTSGYVFPLFGDADRSRLWWIYALVWVAGAAVIAWRSGPALSSGARS